MIILVTKHLGKENISVTWDYNEFFFKIEIIENKQSYNDYIQIIGSINEPFALFNFVYHKNDHLTFQIIILKG